MASMDKKVRYVRCAKCLKLLIEFADVPVYQCGGCGTLLQAKYYRAPKESRTLGSVENNIPDSLPEDPSSGSGTALEEQIAPSTVAETSALTHVEDNGMLSTLSSSSSSAEQNCYQRGEPSKDVETGTKDTVSDIETLTFRSNAEYGAENQSGKSMENETENCPIEEDENSSRYIHPGSEDLMRRKLEEDHPAFGSITEYSFKSEAGESIPAECLKEEVGKPPNLSQPGSSSSMMSDKLGESPESVNHRVTSEEDFLAIEYLLSPTRSSQTYEGSLSSLDDRSNDCFASPSRSFGQQRILSSDDSKEKGGEDAFGPNKMVSPPPKLQDHAFKSSSDKHIDRFDSNREESSSRYGIRRQERGRSLDSACFHSVQDMIDHGCSIRSASRETYLKGDSHNYENGSTSVKIEDLEQDNSELLRKVDELRHQLSELYNQREGKIRYHTRTPSQQNIFFNHNSRQEFSHYLKPNLVRHPQVAYYRPRISVPQQNQFSQMSLSGETRCSCLHCHSEDHHMQLLPNYCQSGPGQACTYNICPSNDRNPHLPADYGMHDLDLEKLLQMKKRQNSKRHCRPLSGAAPFVICYKCLKLLQLPADFLTSRRRLQKLQCGACSKILLLSFDSGTRMTTPSKVFHPPSGVGSDTDAPTGHQISDSRADSCPERDRLSFSEEYGLSFTQSYSTDTTPVPSILGNSFEERQAREEPNSAFQRQVGYGSATEILYQPNDDDDEGYESAEPMR